MPTTFCAEKPGNARVAFMLGEAYSFVTCHIGVYSLYAFPYHHN